MQSEQSSKRILRHSRNSSSKLLYSCHNKNINILQTRCSSLAYKDLGKDIYQIEVPKGVSVPSDWIKLSNTAVSIYIYVFVENSAYCVPLEIQSVLG